jgi:pimeloyl-ACP methyl ester carboxylesterase
MRPGSLQPTIFLAACLFATGCGLNTAVLQKGGNGRMGVLLNYSCGASVCDPIDPSRPTIVITHGWNPLPNQIRTTFGPSAAEAIKCRCGDSYNLLSWDWNGVRISPFNDEPLRVGKQQGRMMAAALRARGVDPSQTQIIGHSLGTLVATQTAVCLQDLGPMAQLTLLDPPESYHEQIFYELAPTCHAQVVENYWSPGISGYGAHVPVAGVQNFIVRGTTPVIGIVDLSLSNHVYVMRWYYETIRCPGIPCGFQNSVLLPYCRRATSVGGVSNADSTPLTVRFGDAKSASETPPTINPQLTATSAGSRSR